MSIMQFSGAFSLGKSTNSKIFLSLHLYLSLGSTWYYSKEQKPGPGTYTPSFYDRPKFPKWKFQEEKRKSIIKPNSNPPPWTYKIKSKLGEGLKYTLHDRVDYPKLKYEIVGPGSYDPKIISTKGSCFSFSYKPDEKNADNEVPGPGAYPNEVNEQGMNKTEKKVFERLKMKSEKERFRKTGFGFSTRDSHWRINTEDPGPGHYDPLESHRLQPHSHRFGREERSPASLSSSPGPGTYNTRSNILSKTAFSLYPKIDPDFQKNEKKPGPDVYDPRPIKSSCSIRIGTSLRNTFASPRNQTPGPGTYDAKPLNLSHRWSVSGGERMKDGREKIPGPGVYNPTPSTLGGPKPSLHAKLEQRNAQMKPSTPGPGAYDPSSLLVLHSSPSLSLNKDKKLRDANSFTPGPGRYDIREKKWSGPYYSFAGVLKKNRPAIYVEPGPGHYDIKGTIGLLPGYHGEKKGEKGKGEVTNYFEFKNF